MFCVLNKCAHTYTPVQNRFDYITADLAHDSYGSLARGSSHLVLNQVEHVLIKEEPDEVEGPKAGCTPQGEVTYNHGAEVGTKQGEVSILSKAATPALQC